jgi:hypothetical protein
VEHSKQKKFKKNSKNSKSLIKDHKLIKSSSKIYIVYFFGGARPGSATGCLKKVTQTPNTGHPI